MPPRNSPSAETIKVDGGTDIDNQGWPSVTAEGRGTVHQAIGAQPAWVVIAHLQTSIGIRGNEQRLDAEITLSHRGERRLESGHDAGYHDSLQILHLDRRRRQIADQDAPIGSSVSANGRKPPPADQVRSSKCANLDAAVADVESQTGIFSATRCWRCTQQVIDKPRVADPLNGRFRIDALANFVRVSSCSVQNLVP
jgi:hypothetical protein